jgi:hypothetical protein
MKQEGDIDRRFRTMCWGAVLVLLGGLSLLPGDQTGWAILGTGAALLVLNAARALNNLSVSRFTAAIGALACMVGAVVVIRASMGFHTEVELLPVAMIVIGTALLLAEPMKIGRCYP